ncbi:MAG: N-succinylglutamate 5-semialdehyde dehydrogenase [Myxococcales bacterium]|nr:N-succinylglutamate 5-semialdehyde dehydrogenase [Myxococcales bacterium]
MRHYINGRWVPAADSSEVWVSRSPADGTDVLGEFAEDEAAVEEAIAAARRAWPAWDALGPERRAEHLRALASAFDARKEEVADRIAREVGKPRWEALGEAGALGAKVAVTLADGMEAVQEQVLTPGTSWIDGGYRYRPLGVCAVIGPFNFPLHLPNGHIIPALATGNTCVFKPSELAPACADLYMEIVHEAGLPPGVLNMVQGRVASGKRLVSSPDVNAVLFTGSVHAGIAIRRATVEQPWKLLALEMGGKNTVLVFEDADLDRAAYEIGTGALLTTGQRCSAASRVVVAESLVEGLLARLERIWDGVRVGHPLDPDAFMGPLINAAAKERFLAVPEKAAAEGLIAVRTNRPAQVDGPDGPYAGHYVLPALWRAEPDAVGGEHDTLEIFGPDVIVHVVADGDEERMIEVANATPFGLSMGVITADVARFERLARRLRAGIINFNRSTVGASSRLPFGGVGNSGNHRPAAVLATRYCTYPVATLRQPMALDPDTIMTRFPEFMHGERGE